MFKTISLLIHSMFGFSAVVKNEKDWTGRLFAVSDSYILYVPFCRSIDKLMNETKISSRKLYLYQKFIIFNRLLLLLLLVVFNLSSGWPKLSVRFSTVKTQILKLLSITFQSHDLKILRHIP